VESNYLYFFVVIFGNIMILISYGNAKIKGGKDVLEKAWLEVRGMIE
jgi:hypothetical protein